MAKRFTETSIWSKQWFMSLSCKLKCTVRYLFDMCDNVGLWEPNYVLAKVYIGESVSQDEILSIDGGKQFELLANGKIFIKDFCDFQYGELSDNCKPHHAIIKKLKKEGLFERVCKGYTKGIHTLEEKDKNKKKKKISIEEKGSGEKPEQDKSENLQQKYQEIASHFGEKEISVVGAEIKNFVQEHRPDFPEPYVDAWNYFADKRGLNRIQKVTDLRREKIRIRSREPAFKFFDILTAIGKNKFYLGDGKDGAWKVDFDHVIDSETNYIKILERK